MSTFFRNLTLYSFPSETAKRLDDLGATLDDHRLRPCGPIEMRTRGFVSPYNHADDSLVHTFKDFTLITVGGEDKLLPASVVNDALDKKLSEIHRKEQRRVGAKERKRLKDEIVTDLLPRAFVRSSRQNAYLDTAHGWLVVDTSSRRVGEEVVSLIREAVGRFPAMYPTTGESPRVILTDWLRGSALPDGVSLGDECGLRDPAEAGSTWQGKKTDLQCDEVSEHLRSGKQVFQLGLIYKDRISFVIADDLTIRKVRFLDGVVEELDNEEHDTTESLLNASFFLMASELRQLLSAVSTWFAIERAPDQA